MAAVDSGEYSRALMLTRAALGDLDCEAEPLRAGGLDVPVLSAPPSVDPGRVVVSLHLTADDEARAMARLLTPTAGTVLLDGKDIHATSTKQVATALGMLPQTPVAPDAITVADLVGRGRYPHQGWFRRWTSADSEGVAAAMLATDRFVKISQVV